MKNVTLSLSEDLLDAGRAYARSHHTTLNDLIRELLQARAAPPDNGDWMGSAFALADRARGDSRGKTWRRDELYDR